MLLCQISKFPDNFWGSNPMLLCQISKSPFPFFETVTAVYVARYQNLRTIFGGSNPMLLCQMSKSPCTFLRQSPHVTLPDIEISGQSLEEVIPCYFARYRNLRTIFGGSNNMLLCQMSKSPCTFWRQIFWEVVGLEQGPLSLVSTIEELFGRKSSGSGLESREYGRRDPSPSSRATLYPQKLELTSLTSGGRSVGIVRSRTQATEFSFLGSNT
jgi:hypothetical protein